MKFNDLPLNVPVLIEVFSSDKSFKCNREMIRIDGTFLLDESYGYAPRCSNGYGWANLYIVDQPTDEDAEEIGILPPQSPPLICSVSKETAFQPGAIVKSGNGRNDYVFEQITALNTSEALTIDSSGLGYIVSLGGLTLVSRAGSSVPPQKTEALSHSCTCSLYGPDGLMALGCRCGGR